MSMEGAVVLNHFRCDWATHSESLKSKRRTEEKMMPGNCREEEKKRKKEKMKKRRKEEGCFENSFASSTMRGPPMTYVNDEKKSLY